MINFSKRNNKYGCFSNFYPCLVRYEQMDFDNSEAAYQSMKTFDMNERDQFVGLSGKEAKKLGRKITMRPDWESVKYPLMVDVCFAKFSQNQNLKDILLGTGQEELVENTTGWHDNIWGNCNCPKCKDIPGQNLLGKALMEVRERLGSQQ